MLGNIIVIFGFFKRNRGKELHTPREKIVLKVLVACEFSATVRNSFSVLGHDATSCDLLATEKKGKHYHGDVRDILYDGWDLMIAHPPCTYLCNSGVSWLNRQPERWKMLDDAAEFFNLLLDAPIPHIAVENPVPHKYALERIGNRKYTQAIQPYEYGHPTTKRTCLWLKNLPKLKPSRNKNSSVYRKMANMSVYKRQKLQYLPQSPTRWRTRSKTFEGVASAMASQWTRYLKLHRIER